ncbi:hypothetical protein ABB37_08585 [Leptomonas pyrrhocoris]|uniref:Uncharacterized protein n=1 Tax=Leptomonas pyrrhocoris TaxID=157538 RepID=A0A0N0DS20_LEPPY|nr:hypothetical protein ABB37_08585 [Leptomonas pyrrhocoris]KPA75284.1 hypothetical protein ABB37_08585 [Leptomonas pyrrhocoris]|eukprot:XP_015653723.1 hypothetical protein ABB37_08585 [Leptomonas pyrrhocoris]
MMSDPITPSYSATGHMYEYGEYDGLVDLDALHGAATNATATTTTSTTTQGVSSGGVGGGTAAASPTPNLSCLMGSSDVAGDCSNSTALQGHNTLHASSGEQGATPSPHGRSPAWRQPRDSGTRDSGHGSSAFASRSNGGYPITSDESDVALSAATATAATAAAAPGSRRTSRRRVDSAKGQRDSSPNRHYMNNSNSGTTTAATTSNAADDVVHLPVILPSQQRRPTESLLQPRVRVSPLTQEANPTVPTATTTATANVTVATTSANARSASTVSPLAQNKRSVGAKTVMSANNLAAMQRHGNGNERVYTSPLSTGTSINKAAPFLAPPLSPLHARTTPSHPGNAPTSIGATGGAATTAVTTRPLTDSSVKREESLDVAQSAAAHTVVVDLESPTTRSNGWVREEARRIDRNSHEMTTGFSQERLWQSSAPSNTVTTSPASGRSGAEGGDAGTEKASTLPASTTPRAPVWSNDYEVGRTDLVGLATTTTITTTTDFGAMPRVVAPPLLQRPIKTLSDSSGKRVAPLRPQPAVPSTPPVGTTTSLVESVISPLRAMAPQRTGRPSEAEKQQEQQQHSTAAPPTNTLVTSDNNHNYRKPDAARANLVEGNGHRARSGSSNPSAQHDTLRGSSCSSSAAASTPHTASAVAHRRIMMQAVDTHVSAPAELVGNCKAASSAAQTKLPYTDDDRAALEAWAAFPALDVTIRGQAPTATQLRRERDLAAARPFAAQQLYLPVKGQAPQESAGEPFEMNYDVHNVVVQLRPRNRPLMLAYPPRLPFELDMRPRLRRQRTLRSFYGKLFPHVGDTWFRNALNDARHISSPDIESMEKREEEEFIRNGGDPAQRRNRYGQANNHNANNNNNGQEQSPPQQQQQQRPPPYAGGVAPSIDEINLNAIKMEQPAV